MSSVPQTPPPARPAAPPSAPSRSTLRYNRVAAALAWSLGVAFTYLFLAALGLGLALALGLALGVQALLTVGQRPLWRLAMRRKGGAPALFGLATLAIDAVVNAAGMYPYVPGLARTNVGVMLIEVFRLSPNVSPAAALGLALGLGALVAGLPEYLWELED